MKTLIKRLIEWLKSEYCGWCDGTGIHPRGLAPEIKAEAVCIECRGTGRVKKQQ